MTTISSSTSSSFSPSALQPLPAAPDRGDSSVGAPPPPAPPQKDGPQANPSGPPSKIGSAASVPSGGKGSSSTVTNTTTVTNPNGSVTTTITYANGKTLSTTGAPDPTKASFIYKQEHKVRDNFSPLVQETTSNITSPVTSSSSKNQTNILV